MFTIILIHVESLFKLYFLKFQLLCVWGCEGDIGKIVIIWCSETSPKMSGINFFFELFFILSSVSQSDSIEQQEFLNWKCVICSEIAKSPLHLEMQFIEQHGPYTDLDA